MVPRLGNPQRALPAGRHQPLPAQIQNPRKACDLPYQRRTPPPLQLQNPRKRDCSHPHGYGRQRIRKDRPRSRSPRQDPRPLLLLRLHITPLLRYGQSQENRHHRRLPLHHHPENQRPPPPRPQQLRQSDIEEIRKRDLPQRPRPARHRQPEYELLPQRPLRTLRIQHPDNKGLLPRRLKSRGNLPQMGTHRHPRGPQDLHLLRPRQRHPSSGGNEMDRPLRLQSNAPIYQHRRKGQSRGNEPL